jgi:hypothetical protein
MLDIVDFIDENGDSDVFKAINSIISGVEIKAAHEYEDKIAKLEREVESLQPYKDDRDKVDAELARKLQELEDEKRAVGRAKLTELFGKYGVTMYHPIHTWEYVTEKCDRCNEDRMISFESPRGRRMWEKCECSKQIRIYTPEKVYANIIRRDEISGDALLWYQQRPGDDEWASLLCKAVYEEGMDFRVIDEYGAFFHKEADCQSYCDWLNKQEEEKANKEE